MNQIQYQINQLYHHDSNRFRELKQIENIMVSSREVNTTITTFLHNLKADHQIPSNIYDQLDFIAYIARTCRGRISAAQRRRAILIMASYWDQQINY